MHLFSVDIAYVNHVVCHNQKPGSWILCKVMLKIHQEQKYMPVAIIKESVRVKTK